MLRIVIVGILLFTRIVAEDEVVTFPQMMLYDGEGVSAAFPTPGKQLVFLGFKRGAQKELLQWYTVLRSKKELVEKIPLTVIGAFPSYLSWRITRDPLLSLCKRVVPVEALPYFRITFFDKETFFSHVGREIGKNSSDHIHLFYLDANQHIRWSASGGVTKERLAQLNSVMEDPKA